MAMRKKVVINIPWPKVFLAFAVISTVTGSLFATKTLSSVEEKIAAAKEEARPATIQLTKITTPGCSQCFNLENALQTLKKQNVTMSEEKTVTFDSSEGQALVQQFGINRVPTYILKGEVRKKSLEGIMKANGEIKSDTFVFTKVAPIFIDPVTKKEKGWVTVTYLTDSSCPQCGDLTLGIEGYKRIGVKITDEHAFEWNSPQGQQVISQYHVTKVPTFLFSQDIDFYEGVKTIWQRLGSVEQDGTHIARTMLPPYRDLEKGHIVGLVDMIYLVDANCVECYKPQEVLRNILVQGYRVGIRSERTVDIMSVEGQALKNGYRISKLPTILISPEVDEYAQLKNVWNSVGSVETDGWYVFREMARMGAITYKDLNTNQVIQGGQSPSPSPLPTVRPS